MKFFCFDLDPRLIKMVSQSIEVDGGEEVYFTPASGSSQLSNIRNVQGGVEVGHSVSISDVGEFEQADKDHTLTSEGGFVASDSSVVAGSPETVFKK